VPAVIVKHSDTISNYPICILLTIWLNTLNFYFYQHYYLLNRNNKPKRQSGCLLIMVYTVKK